MIKYDYPKDIDSYLSQMNEELNTLQSQIEDEYSNNGEQGLRKWFSENEIIQKYSILTYSVTFKNVEDFAKAHLATLNKCKETMNLYYRLTLGYDPFPL